MKTLKNLKILRKKCAMLFLPLLFMAMAGLSCSDEVDESNLYVFTGEQATDYIASQPELSKYLVLLKKAKSGKKGSTMDHMLEARGNYTCFVPTNDAVQAFIDSVYDTKNYDVNAVPDSFAQVIVFNSIIDRQYRRIPLHRLPGRRAAAQNHGRPLYNNRLCGKRHGARRDGGEHVLQDTRERPRSG